MARKVWPILKGFEGALVEPIVRECIKLNALADPTAEDQERQLEIVKLLKLHHPWKALWYRD